MADQLTSFEIEIKANADSAQKASEVNQKLARSFEYVSKNAGKLNGAASQLQKFTAELSSFASQSKGMSSSITQFSNAMQKLSDASKMQISKSGLVDSISAVNKVLKGSGFSDKTTNYINSLSKLGTALTKITNAANIANTADNITTGLANIQQAIAQFSTGAGSINSVTAALQGLSKTASSMANLTPTKVSNDTTPKQVINESLAEAEKKTGDEAEKASTKVEKFNNAIGRTKHQSFGAVSALKKIGKSLLNFINPFKDIKNALSSMNGALSRFTRMLTARVLRQTIMAMISGFKEGIDNLYTWAELVDNKFKSSMDSLVTSMNYVKNSLAAMVSPLIDALAPALDFLVDKFVMLINYVNQLFATLTGASTWREATKQATEYTTATSSAADATKKLNIQLMDFDELNNITTSNSGSSGSGSSGSTVDSDTFVTHTLPDWAQTIQDAINNGDWAGAGKLLADKLNGVIEEWDSYASGKSLGEKINNALSFIHSALSNFDWKGLGSKIADYINGLFDSIDPKVIGGLIADKFNMAFGFLSGFTGALNWDEIGTWIGAVIETVIEDIQWDKLGETIKNIAIGLKDMLISAIKQIDGNEILNAIGEFFKGLGWDGFFAVMDITLMVAGFKILFKRVLPEAFSGLLGNLGLSGLFSGKTTTGIGTAVTGTGIATSSGLGISGLQLASLLLTGASLVETGSGLASGGVDGAVDALNDSINPLTRALSTLTMGFGQGFMDWGKYYNTSSDFIPWLFRLINGDSKQTTEKYEQTQAEKARINTIKTKQQELMDKWGVDTYQKAQALENSRNRKNKIAHVVSPDATESSYGLSWKDQFNSLLQKYYSPTGTEEDATALREGLTELAKFANDSQMEQINQILSEFPGGTSSSGFDIAGAVRSVISATADSSRGVKKATKIYSSFADEVDRADSGILNISPDASDMAYAMDTPTSTASKNINRVTSAAHSASSSISAISPDATEAAYGVSKATKDMERDINTVTKATTSTRRGINAIEPDATEAAYGVSKATKDMERDVKTVTNQTSALRGNLVAIPPAVDKINSKTLTIKGIDKTKSNLTSTYAQLENWYKLLKKVSQIGDVSVTVNGSTAYAPYANGGFPAQGSLFLAGETIGETELVGNINGKTGVASGQEITGIATAVYDTGTNEAKLLQEQNQLLMALLAKDSSVVLAPNATAGKWIATASAAYAKARG